MAGYVVQKEELEAYHKGSISRGLFEKLNTEIDARLLNINNMES